MLIVMVSGKARHGKDTFAGYLTGNLRSKGYKTQILRFGDPVKDHARLYHGWDGKKDANGRALLQKVGNDKRGEDGYYWASMVEEEIAFDTDFVIIADTRYEDEIRYFKNRDYGVFTIRVIRYKDGLPFVSDLTEEQLNHISETNLDNYPFDIKIQYDEDLKEVLKVANTIGDLLGKGR